jgi:acyl carrier protein
MSDMKTAIEATLAKFWDERALVTADQAETVDGFVDQMDSLTAIEALIELEKITQIEIDEGVVLRTGGYESREQFIGDLTERVLKFVSAKI